MINTFRCAAWWRHSGSLPSGSPGNSRGDEEAVNPVPSHFRWPNSSRLLQPTGVTTSILLPGFLHHSLWFSNSPHALTCPFMKSLSSNYPNWSVFSVIFLQCICFWLQWVLVAAWGLSPVVARGAYSSWQGAEFSLWSLLLLWSPSSRHTDSDGLVHRLSCSAAPGLLPDQGLNLCPLYK